MGAPTNYAALVARIRTDGNDTATSNPHLGETPIGLRNGVNTLFRLAYPNVVPASIFMTYGASIRSAAGFTVLDAASSYLQLAVPPDFGSTATQPFFFDFFSQWFVDADYNSMIDTATEELGTPAGTAVVEGLYPALIKYVLSHYWNRRASQFANLFASKVATADTDPSTPAKAFTALAAAARKEGNALRDAYMKGFGMEKMPFSGTVTMRIDPITPPY